MSNLHRHLQGANLHDPKGRSPTPLVLDYDTVRAYEVRFNDSAGDSAVERRVFVVDTYDVNGSVGARARVIVESESAGHWIPFRIARGSVELTNRTSGPQAGGVASVGQAYNLNGDLWWMDSGGTTFQITGAGRGRFNYVEIEQSQGVTTPHYLLNSLVGFHSAISAIDITLPNASDVAAGTWMWFKDIDNASATNEFRLLLKAGDSLNGAMVDGSISANGDGFLIWSDGVTDWYGFATSPTAGGGGGGGASNNTETESLLTEIFAT